MGFPAGMKNRINNYASRSYFKINYEGKSSYGSLPEY
jgi:hypothetical protein